MQRLTSYSIVSSVSILVVDKLKIIQIGLEAHKIGLFSIAPRRRSKEKTWTAMERNGHISWVFWAWWWSWALRWLMWLRWTWCLYSLSRAMLLTFQKTSVYWTLASFSRKSCCRDDRTLSIPNYRTSLGSSWSILSSGPSRFFKQRLLVPSLPECFIKETVS